MKIQTALISAMLGVLATGSAAAQAPAAGEPYALRGVRLGITLDEFRSFPNEDDEEYAERKPVCSTDEYRPLPEGDRELGVVRCEWHARRKLTDTVGQMFTVIAEGGGFASFDFIPDNSGTPRLFRIVVDGNMQYWDGMYPAFVKGYGPPLIKRGKTQNQLGNSFDTTTATWMNGVSRIRMESRCVQINFMCTTYTHTALGKIYDAKVAARSAAAASKL